MSEPESTLYENDAQLNDASHITLLRILDVQYALLVLQDRDVAVRLIDKHKKGGLIAPQVNFDVDELLDQG